MADVQSWLMFWTAAVVIGLVVEYGHDIWRLIRRWEFDRVRGREIIGGILITSGVAGELFVGVRQSMVETNLRTVNHEVITLLNREMVGRQFPEEQVAKIGDSLKQFTGREVFVSSYAGDAEAARLGLQIKAALQRAGLHVANELGRAVATSGGVAFGVKVSGPDADKDLTDAIAESLQTLGRVEATGHTTVPSVRFGEAVTGVMVALRPLPLTRRRKR